MRQVWGSAHVLSTTVSFGSKVPASNSSKPSRTARLLPERGSWVLPWIVVSGLLTAGFFITLLIGLVGSDNPSKWFVASLVVLPPLGACAYYATGRRAPRWAEVLLCVLAVPYGLAALLLFVYALAAVFTLLRTV